jgi:nicotinamidase-related amidase
LKTKNLSTSKKTGCNTALLVIDVQRGLFQKSTPIFDEAALLANLCTLIERAHQAGAPVFFIQHADDHLLVPSSQEWQLHPQLQPAKADVNIHKRHGNAFLKTDLEKQLDALKVGNLVISGLVTHGCVRATCLGALELGYRVILAQDAHSNFSKGAGQVIVEWNAKLNAAGVALQATSEIDYFRNKE